MSAPMFSQRHYEFLAEFLGKECRWCDEPTLKYLLFGLRQRLATSLASDNDKFKRDKFIERIDDVASNNRR